MLTLLWCCSDDRHRGDYSRTVRLLHIRNPARNGVGPAFWYLGRLKEVPLFSIVDWSPCSVTLYGHGPGLVPSALLSATVSAARGELGPSRRALLLHHALPCCMVLVLLIIGLAPNFLFPYTTPARHSSFRAVGMRRVLPILGGRGSSTCLSIPALFSSRYATWHM